MSDAAIKVLEDARGLSAEDRQFLRECLDADAAMAGVPQEVIDDELREVEARMAAHDANPTPGIPWPEALASLRARLAEHRAGK